MTGMSVTVTIDPVARVKWRLSEFLRHNNVTAYKLAHTVKTARANTIYRIAREGDELKRVDFEVLADMLMGLRELTGKDVQLTDLLEFDPTDN